MTDQQSVLPVSRDYRDTDAVALSGLFESCMRETYGQPNAVLPDVLRDAVGRHFDIVLAVKPGERVIGFAAWRETDDLHNTVAGGEIPDLYGISEQRGRLVAIRLVAAVGSAVLSRGGKFIRADVLGGKPSRLARIIFGHSLVDNNEHLLKRLGTGPRPTDPALTAANRPPSCVLGF